METHYRLLREIEEMHRLIRRTVAPALKDVRWIQQELRRCEVGPVPPAPRPR